MEVSSLVYCTLATFQTILFIVKDLGLMQFRLTSRVILDHNHTVESWGVRSIERWSCLHASFALPLEGLSAFPNQLPQNYSRLLPSSVSFYCHRPSPSTAVVMFNIIPTPLIPGLPQNLPDAVRKYSRSLPSSVSFHCQHHPQHYSHSLKFRLSNTVAL
jgi:hypothetical protein